MNQPSVSRTTRSLRIAVLLACCATALLWSQSASALPLVATDGTSLTRFDSASPGITNTVTVNGMQSGETLVGIDYRPADGQLYGVGSASRLYKLDPVTGAATLVGELGSPGLNGTSFGTDFNPVADRLRVVSNTEQNLRVNPANGAIAVVDSPLNPPGHIVAVAYTNNFSAATQTTLFGIDSASGQLVRIGSVDGTPDSPNTGKVTNIGTLNRGTNFHASVGFDIAPNGTAYAAIVSGGPIRTRLYTVNLNTGDTAEVGQIGSGFAPYVGLAAVAGPIVVTNTNDAGAGSLRQAILDANGSPNTDDTIAFSIPGAGPHIITPASQLPTITDKTTIDGTSEPSFDAETGAPVVVLNGTGAGNNANGLVISGASAAGCTVRGLRIQSFAKSGILIADAPLTRVVGNYIGTDGVADLGNGSGGFFDAGVTILGASPNGTIGGTTLPDRNVISGNGLDGAGANVIVSGGATDNTMVLGNFIGTNAAGTAAIDPGEAAGIFAPAADRLAVGGTAPGAGNLISGNVAGVALWGATNTSVAGNLIGTDATGTSAIPNTTGVMAEGSPITFIGSEEVGGRNLISGNTTGVVIKDPVLTSHIAGNFIGTDITGMAALGNVTGVLLDASTDTRVGQSAGNVISGNTTGLVIRHAKKVVVRQNLIGTAADGVTPLGNTAEGVRIESDDASGQTTEENEIGGSAQRNTIAFNGGAGVLVTGANSINNSIRLDSIHSNGGLGIDLAPAGPTPNDEGDGDTGPNGLQNFPVLDYAIAKSAEAVEVSGTLHSAPSTQYFIEIYGNNPDDPEGRVFLNLLSYTTDASGIVNFTTDVLAGSGQTITATATRAVGVGGTSEFSPPVAVNGGGALRFSAATYSVAENAGVATITLTRVDGSDGAVSVQYATSDGTAQAGSDYTSVSGTINFAKGQTTATFEVPIADDSAREGDETINLTLNSPVGAFLSSPASAVLTIAVNDLPTVLGNIATRLRVETGDNLLIGGITITGTQPKKMIVRAIGPSADVPGALADPQLQLYAGDVLLTANDNWRDASNQQEIIDTTLAPPDERESAILITLNPGQYTAVVSGVNGDTGVGLVDAYDLDRTVDSKFANIATRGLLQTGDDVMIGGLTVLGDTQQTVLVRAIGPSLQVAGKLANPTLQLVDANGDPLATNDNWRDDQEEQIQATTIPPPDDLESAILATLAPAQYTAVVRGAGETSGVALVEVYALD